MKIRDKSLWIYISAACLLIIVFLLIILSNALIQLRYKDFKLAYADSVTYAYENESLRAEYNGDITHLSHRNALSIYRAIVGGGFGKYERKEPDATPILLDFGNGDTMWIWKKDSTTVTVKYVPEIGREYFYSTLEVSRFVCFERLVSLEWGNSSWDE